jgi:hypothetical protein
MESKSSEMLKSKGKVLTVIVWAVLVIALFCVINDNDDLKAQNSELLSEIQDKDEKIADLEEWKTVAYKEATDKSDAVIEYLKDENEQLREKYVNLDQELKSVKLQKSVPVYYCNHSENSAVELIYDYMNYGLWFVDPEYSDDEGRPIVYITDEIVEEYNMWWDWFADVCGYDQREEYEDYLWYNEDYDAIDDLYSGYEARREKWLEAHQ